MFDRFTYKQRNYGLLILSVMLAIVSYKRSFSLTLIARTEIQRQEQRIESTDNAVSELKILENQIDFLNRKIGKSNIKPYVVQQKILASIAATLKQSKVELDKIEATHNFETVDFNIYSNQIVLRGGFNGILTYVYGMENKFEYAQLANFEMFVKKNNYTKSKDLYARIIFQNYNQKNR